MADNANAGMRSVSSGVLARQLVACLAAWNGCPVAALHVDPMRDRLKMLGANAGFVSTEVIEFESLRNWSHEKLVHQTVDQLARTSSVLSDSRLARPIPATSGKVADYARPDASVSSQRRSMLHCATARAIPPLTRSSDLELNPATATDGGLTSLGASGHE